MIRAADPIGTGRAVTTGEIQKAHDARRIVCRRSYHRKSSSRMTEQQHLIWIYPRLATKRLHRAEDVASGRPADIDIVPIVARSRKAFGKLSFRAAKSAAHDRYRRVAMLRKRDGRTEEIGRRLLSHRSTEGVADRSRRAVDQHDKWQAPWPIRPDDHALKSYLASV